jgi:hypothetical protein
VSKETRLAAKLKTVTPLGSRVWPLLAPAGQSTPAATYQLVSDRPENSAGGTSGTYRAEFAVRVQTFVADGEAGYTKLVAAADAIVAAVSGWTDGDGDVWHMHNQGDDLGALQAGADVQDLYMRTIDLSVWYART